MLVDPSTLRDREAEVGILLKVMEEALSAVSLGQGLGGGRLPCNKSMDLDVDPDLDPSSLLKWGLWVLKKVLPTGEGSRQGVEEPGQQEAGAMSIITGKVLSFLLRNRRVLMFGSRSLHVSEAFLDLLSSCPDAPDLLHFVLAEIEAELSAAMQREEGTAEFQLVACYFQLLAQMVGLYELQVSTFERQLLEEASSTGPGYAVGEDAWPEAILDPVTNGRTGDNPRSSGDPDSVDADPTSGHQRPPAPADGSLLAEGREAVAAAPSADRPPPDDDYMRGEDRAQRVAAAVRLFVDGLVESDTAPANRIPVLTRVLEPRDGLTEKTLETGSGPGSGSGSGSRSCAGPVESPVIIGSAAVEAHSLEEEELLQVFALRALGRLMELSSRLAQAHGHVLARALLLLPCQHHHEGAAAGPLPLDPARDPPVACPDIPRGRACLMTVAVRVAEALLLSNPNANGWLLPKLEALISELMLRVASSSEEGASGIASGGEALGALHVPLRSEGPESLSRQPPLPHDNGHLDAAGTGGGGTIPGVRGGSAHIDNDPPAVPLRAGERDVLDQQEREGDQGEQHPGLVLLRSLLVVSVESFSRILSADKLKLSPTTYELLGKLLLTDVDPVCVDPVVCGSGV